MQLIVVGLLAIVVLIAFVALARHFGGAALLTSIGNAFRRAGATFATACDVVYSDYIVPAFRKLGWYVIGFMLVGVLGSALLWLFGSVVKWWVMPVGLLITLVTLAVLVWNGLVRYDPATRAFRRTTVDEFSVGTVTSAVVIGPLALGLWLFAAAHICVGQAVAVPANVAPLMDARSLAILGAVFVTMAIEALFLVLDLVAHLAKLGVDFAEGTGGLIISVVKGLLASGVKGLAGVNFNIADQEGFKPAVAKAKAKVKTAVMPILALGCLMPYPAVLGFTLVAGAFTYFLFERMEAVGIDTLGRKQSASRFLEIVGYVLLAALALVVFVPPLQAEFDALILKVGELLVGAVRTVIAAIAWVLGIKSHTFTGFPWYAAALGTLFTAAVAAVLWPNGATTGFVRRVRQGVAVPFMVMAMAGIVSLTVTIFSWGSADQIGIDNGVTLSKMPAPKVAVVTAGAAPAVRLTYPEIPRAAGGYVYERRLITDRTWTPLGNVADGVVHFDDTSVTAGTAYAYRVAATFPSGQKEFSREVLVSVPAPVASASVTPPPPPPPTARRTACSGPTCGNPGLDSYCRHHPDVCAAR